MRSSDTTDPPVIVQRWYSPRQAAEYTGFTIHAIREHIRRGTLPAYIPRGSRLVRIHVDDLDAMVADARWSYETSPTASASSVRARQRDAAGSSGAA